MLKVDLIKSLKKLKKKSIIDKIYINYISLYSIVPGMAASR